jgi:hypothetical protein
MDVVAQPLSKNAGWRGGGSGLSDDLRLASDTVLYLGELFIRRWKRHLKKLEAEGS